MLSNIMNIHHKTIAFIVDYELSKQHATIVSLFLSEVWIKGKNVQDINALFTFNLLLFYISSKCIQ